MSKKAVAQITSNPESREPEPELPAEVWRGDWGIHRRLLEARKILRTAQLSETFKIPKMRDFEAFSIHQLADECERVLNELGVVSDFATTKWFKSGNSSIVEGVTTFRCVDSDETHSIPSVGEGIDGSDKGFGKAVSYARKNGYISAFQLAVGTNNEASDEKPEGVAAPIQGAPQQAYQTSSYVPQQPYHGQPTYQNQQAQQPATQQPVAQQTAQPAPAGGPGPGVYSLNLIGQPQLVRKLDVVNLCTQAINSCGTLEAVDDLISRNQDELKRVWAEDKANGFAISEQAGIRKGNLQRASEAQAAA
jgi:hypothetical protein